MMTSQISHKLQPGSLLRLGALLALIGISVVSAATTPQKETPAIKPGETIERDLKGGETHTYQLALATGQFLHLVVEQKGIDVAVTLSGPDGHSVCEADSPNASFGPEPIVIIAEQTGSYQLKVTAPNAQAPAGRYQISIIALRQAAPEDQSHVIARRTFQEAVNLYVSQDAAAPGKALAKYQAALQYFQAHKDAYWHALTLFGIGMVYAQTSDFRRVLEYHNQALPIFQAIGDQRMVGETLNYLGGAYDILGELHKAMQYYEQALPILHALHNQAAEASVLNNIGKIYDNFADYQRTLEYYRRSLPLFRAIGDKDGEANTARNIGVTYITLGEPDKAVEFFQQSLLLYRATGRKRGEATTLSSLGYACILRDDPQKAIELFNQALALQRATSDRRSEGATLRLLGNAWSMLGQQNQALESLHQALELNRAIQDRRSEALTLGWLGQVYSLKGQPEKALESATQALAIFCDIGDRRGQAVALVNLARAERDRGNLAEARRQIEAATALIEAVRAEVSSQQLRASFLAAQQNSYQLYIDVLMRLHALEPAAGHDGEALQVSERARARSLLELLAEARVDFRQGVNAKLLARERELSQLLNASAARLTQRNSAAQLTALKQEISALETEYQQVEAAIRQASPRYAAVTQPQPLGLRGIQQLLDQDTLLLEYSLGPERSFLWAVTSHSLTTRELPKQAQINQAATTFYDLLTARSLIVKGETTPQKQARISQADARLPAAARELSKIILPPEVLRPGLKRLVIVADGALQYVPFAALPTPEVGSRKSVVGNRNEENQQVGSQKSSEFRIPNSDYRLLLADYEIITLPSASTLDVMRRELAGREPAPKMLAVIADPVFSADDERCKIRAIKASNKPGTVTASRRIEHEEEKAGQLKFFAGLKVPRLPFTRREADQILALTPQGESFRAVDFKASRATAMSAELSRYRYLHFATHGWLDSQRPDFSALVLSLVDEQGRPQDGFLRANEIYNLDLPAELVVLSACQTGLGKEVKGEGLVGLTRSFMYAGARRVIVSLWNVNDQATSELMTQLYRQMLRNGQAPASALRQAQLALWKQQPWSAPYYWAAFVIQGEWK